MLKLKIKWMLLVISSLHHILWILDDLQGPYERRSDSIKKLYTQHSKMAQKLEKELE